jgi:hypothetical protein
MEQDQINITTMQSGVADYMGNNKSIWIGVKAVSDAVASLVANNKIIADKADVQGNATDGATDLKFQAKHNLEDKIIEIADQLNALGAKTNNPMLVAQSHFSASELDHMEDGDLERTAGDIATLATANLAALADYNILQADVDALNTLKTAFTAVKNAPKTAIAKRSGQTTTLPLAIAANQKLLKTQLDKLLTKFKKTNPEFYAGYLAARVVVNRRSHHQPKQPSPLPKPAA